MDTGRLSGQLMDQPIELSQRAVELFHHSIDNCMQSIEPLAGPIGEASMRLVQCLLSDHKILTAGDGNSGLIAQQFSTNMLNHFGYERPGLPAINLSADAATLTGIACDSSYSDIYAKQIRALGHDGDVLLLAYQGAGSGTTLRCIQAAHERGMDVITLCNQEGGEAAALLDHDDIEIQVPSSNNARVTEIHLLVVHCLCALIDEQIFG